MSQKSKLSLSRQQFAAFLADPNAIRAFERVFRACDSVEDILLPLAPLSAALSADFSYSAIPNVPGIYPIKIPAAYLKASAGGPFTLTLSTGVIGKDSVLVPIAKSTDTIDSGPLLFDVEVDAVGNLTSKAWDIDGHNSNGSWVKFADGTLRQRLFTSSSVAISTAYGSLFIGAISWTFPVTCFSSTPVVTLTAYCASRAIWVGGHATGVSSTAVAQFLTDVQAGTSTVYQEWTCEDRWK
jgi:hypothetical protein